MIENSGPILIASGMHRSGTSLLASMLINAGLELGSRFRPADVANARGYFENVDFVELHCQFLYHHRLSEDGFTLERDLRVPPDLRRKAERAVKKNSRPHPWGWKDPRTTLFLDFWADCLPQSKFVFIYRAPWEVIDSLFRRGDDVFRQDPSLAVRVWEHYNCLLLDFHRRHPDRCLLVSLDSVKRDSRSLIRAIRDKLSVPLTGPIQEVFDESLLTEESSTAHQASLLRASFPGAHRLWLELGNSSGLDPGHSQSTDSIADTSPEAFGDLMLENWMETRLAQLERREAEKSMDRLLWGTRSDLYHAHQRIEFMERSRVWKLRDKLDAARRFLRWTD